MAATITRLAAPAKVDHPDPLRFGDEELVRIDDPLADVFPTGDRLLGWEGDPALQLYFNPKRGCWSLMRYCPDGRYRVIRSVDGRTAGAMDVIAHLVVYLVEHDSHRGYDHAADVIAHNQAVTDRADAVIDDAIDSEWGPRFAAAVRRDVAA